MGKNCEIFAKEVHTNLSKVIKLLEKQVLRHDQENNPKNPKILQVEK